MPPFDVELVTPRLTEEFLKWWHVRVFIVKNRWWHLSEVNNCWVLMTLRRRGQKPIRVRLAWRTEEGPRSKVNIEFDTDEEYLAPFAIRSDANPGWSVPGLNGRFTIFRVGVAYLTDSARMINGNGQDEENSIVLTPGVYKVKFSVRKGVLRLNGKPKTFYLLVPGTNQENTAFEFLNDW